MIAAKLAADLITISSAVCATGLLLRFTVPRLPSYSPSSPLTQSYDLFSISLPPCSPPPPFLLPTLPPSPLPPPQTQGRESIAAKLVANLITEAGANRVLACDLHSGQSMGYFDIPVDHVYGQVGTVASSAGHSAVQGTVQCTGVWSGLGVGWRCSLVAPDVS